MKNSAAKLLLAFVLLVLPFSSSADDEINCDEETSDCPETTTHDQSDRMLSLASPEQVENRLDIDSNQVTPLFSSHFGRGYFDWKDRIRNDNGVGIGGDYSFAYLKASNSLNTLFIFVVF